MSTQIAVELSCDGLLPNGDLCTAAWLPDWDDLESATRQRRAAAQAGWQVNLPDGTDLCPGPHQT